MLDLRGRRRFPYQDRLKWLCSKKQDAMLTALLAICKKFDDESLGSVLDAGKTGKSKEGKALSKSLSRVPYMNFEGANQLQAQS